MTKGSETRERILETAFRLSARDGLEGLSLGSLADQMGLSKSGLYAHFSSKEELQVETLRAAAGHFTQQVLVPAFRNSERGLPRLRALFDHWLRWAVNPSLPGGCPMVAASIELDDRPGPARDYLVQAQKDLMDTLARSARMCVEAGHFRSDLDVHQMAFELDGIFLAYNHARRLLRDPRAERRARAAFERLVEDASQR
jgi:AcrR family transcriptional regulator